MLALHHNAARYIQIHYLVSQLMANRNEDGTLKSIRFGGFDRARQSSQSAKFTQRYCDDPELGIRTIRDPGNPTAAVPNTNPSRTHFERVLSRVQDRPEDERTKTLVVKAVYDTVVGLKGAEGKADSKRSDAQERLEKAQAALTAAEETLHGADAKGKREAEKKVKKAAEVVQRCTLALHAAGGEVEMDDDTTAMAQSKSTTATDQIMIFSDVEIDLLVQLTTESLSHLRDAGKSVHQVVKTVVTQWKAKHGDTFRTMRLGCGIQAAVFGRPVYGGGIFQSAMGAVGVGHPISVHEQHVHYDTFTARDVLKSDAGEMGAGMVGELPMSSALLYGYTYIDTHLLIENIERGAVPSAIAAEVVKRLILMTSRLSSKTKQGSLAGKQHSWLTLIEVGSEQPARFDDAFMNPVTVDAENRDMALNAFQRLATYIQAHDGAHPSDNKRAMAVVDVSGHSALRSVVPLIMDDKSLATWAVVAANGEDHAEMGAPKHHNGNGARAPAVAE